MMIQEPVETLQDARPGDYVYWISRPGATEAVVHSGTLIQRSVFTAIVKEHAVMSPDATSVHYDLVIGWTRRRSALDRLRAWWRKVWVAM